MSTSISVKDCGEQRNEVYRAVNRNTPRWAFKIFVTIACIAMVGCYGWVWASNGVISTAIAKLDSRVSELDKSLAVFATATEAQTKAIDERAERFTKLLEEHTKELRVISETLIRIERDGGMK